MGYSGQKRVNSSTTRVITLILCAFVLTGVLAATEPAGEIRGQLSITRSLTKKRVVLPSGPVRGAAPHAHAAEASPINEWDRIAVYLEGVNAPKPEAVTAKINQKGQRFEPEMVVVPVGSTVSFPNSDPIFHNVFSLSKAKQFDLGFYPAGETRVVKFDHPGVVQVYCHLHPDMSAAILVAPNAWYKRPDDHGNFDFSNIPSGSYEVVVWHKSAGFFRRSIRVQPGGVATVAMEIPVDVEDDRP
jgi:plastocyanin